MAATRPKFGTRPINCAKYNCKWKGLETDLAKKPIRIGGVNGTALVCPRCGHDSYQFMTERQVENWKVKTSGIER